MAGDDMHRDCHAGATDTVARFERGDDLKQRTIEALQRTFEAAGVAFIDENGGGAGVRPRKRHQKKIRQLAKRVFAR
jgi:hypothetical protein